MPTSAHAQVEAVLRQHPGVEDAAVFGVPDVRMGEAVAAAVVLQPEWAWHGMLLGRGPSEAVVEEPPQQQQQQQQQQQERVLTADKLRAFCRTGVVDGAEVSAPKSGGSEDIVPCSSVACPCWVDLLQDPNTSVQFELSPKRRAPQAA